MVLEDILSIISYFETFINSDCKLDKVDVNDKIKIISNKYFENVVKIKALNLPYGGWEIRAKGLKNQWVKAYIIDEGFTFKLYWHNSNEFLGWVVTIIMHELAIYYNSTVYSGRDLRVVEPEKSYFKTFKGYLDNLNIAGPEDAKSTLIQNTIPKIIRKKFNI